MAWLSQADALVCARATLAVLVVHAATSFASASEPAGTWFTQPQVNPTLEPLDPPVDLRTPHSTVETFILSGREGTWDRAARTLNFRLIPDVDEERAQQLAERLHFVLKQEMWVDWEALPDRPDAIIPTGALGSNDPLAGEARRSILLGHIRLDNREAPIRVRRVAAGELNPEPVWLFSPQTVSNIDAWYASHGPSWLAQRMPDWARTRGLWRVPLWQWITLALALVLSGAAGWVASKAFSRRVFSVLPGRAEEAAKAIRPALVVLAGAIVFWVIVVSFLALPAPTASVVEIIARLAFVAAASWLVMRLVTYSSKTISREMIEPADDGKLESEQRRALTQLTVARYAILLLVALVAVAVVLIQLDMFRAIGIALLTSAGAAAVILGIAGHAVLGNLIAGLQIALTRPFRIGDTVMIEGNWGVIEDISYTYVIERTWDDRRLIIPIKYFINEHFDNWSKTDEYLTKPIYLNVDYRADVQRIREKFFELLERDEEWDPDIDDPKVLVYECGDETMTVRLTCGAKDPSSAWWLHCRMREQILAWLQGVENGAWLPRQRVMLDPASAGDGSARDGNGRATREGRPRPHVQAGETEGGHDGDGDGR